MRHGAGSKPLGAPSDTELSGLHSALRAAGRDPADVGGVRGRFSHPDTPADLDDALEEIPAQAARGFGSICIKPLQFLDDLEGFGPWCETVITKLHALG